MDDWIWIVVALAAVAVVLLSVYFGLRRAAQRRRSARLRERFGPEYDTAVRRFGRTQGERHLEELLDRHDQRRVRDVTDGERDVALRSLEAVQTSFVDSPVTAVRAADQLVFDVLRERGYPLETLDERASALAVEEPELAHRYRQAHGTLAGADTADGSDGGDVARLRDAFLTYRDLLRELVGAPDVTGRLVTGPAPETSDLDADHHGSDERGDHEQMGGYDEAHRG
jgi:hypothetical protein